MELSISNIAWPTEDDEAMASLLARLSMTAIDVAPGKYFPDPGSTRREDIHRVRDWWLQRGVRVFGMQSLLFGTTGLNLFGSPPVQLAMLEHLRAIARIGRELGAARLVFGSPKNRDRGDLSSAQAIDLAVPFFRHLGDVGNSEGVVFCLEPNPPGYGANFMTTADETAAVVAAVDHPSIRMQWDSGAITMNGEDPAVVLTRHATLIGHVHASEPQLVPLGEGGCDHSRMNECLRRHLPQAMVCVEMLTPVAAESLATIERSLTKAILHYRDPGPAV